MSNPKRVTRQHRSGNSYSVRLPREMAYADPRQELEIEMRGDERVIRPTMPRITIAEFIESAVARRERGGTSIGPEALIRPDVPRPWDKR